jgi:hypothetical protein
MQYIECGIEGMVAQEFQETVEAVHSIKYDLYNSQSSKTVSEAYLSFLERFTNLKKSSTSLEIGEARVATSVQRITASSDDL